MAMRKAAVGGAGLAAVLAIGLPFAATWEGVVYSAHWDRYAKIYDICHGNTMIDGRPVQRGDTATPAQCDAMFRAAYTAKDAEMLRAFPKLAEAPASVRAMADDLAFNAGTGAISKAKATGGALRDGRWRDFCVSLPKWNKAGGQWVRGLFNRRVEAKEICLSGLKE